MPNPLKTSISVRDYECDLQGIVNNAVYMNYLEHARHQWLRAHEIDFKTLHDQGLDLVLVKVELDFKKSLVPGDQVELRTKFSQESKLRWLCEQEILRSNELILTARTIGTCIDRKRGKPVECVALNSALNTIQSLICKKQ